MALRAHFDAASGLAGPRPIVSFRFFIYTDNPGPFLGLTHQVLVHARVNEASVPIGPAFLPGSHRFERASGEPGPQVSPVLPIDFATLRWIEEQRAGRGGVTFYFDWNVLGQDEGFGSAGGLRNEPVSMAIGGTPFPVTLPQEVWLQILHDVRYRDVAVIEIPLVRDPGSVLDRAHEHLDTARERLYRADDRGVLVACGEALDVLPNWRRVKLSKEYGYEDLVFDLTEPIFDSGRKADRLGKVLSGIRQMCLSGKHDEAGFEGKPIPIDHKDAELAFLMTAAAISYLDGMPLEDAAHEAGSRNRRRRSRRGGATPEMTAPPGPREASQGRPAAVAAAPAGFTPTSPEPTPAPATDGGSPGGASSGRRRRSRRGRGGSGSGGEGAGDSGIQQAAGSQPSPAPILSNSAAPSASTGADANGAAPAAGVDGEAAVPKPRRSRRRRPAAAAAGDQPPTPVPAASS
ncbi:MAG: hypothetical protein JO247_11265, partial [Chloroflexi bacterium]|nr:hypothetical protein [Chloroflexota bacterium]